jgi:hypothetical protein
LPPAPESTPLGKEERRMVLVRRKVASRYPTAIPATNTMTKSGLEGIKVDSSGSRDSFQYIGPFSGFHSPAWTAILP